MRKIFGFTMMEMVVVIVIISILAAASGRVINQGFSTYTSSKDMTLNTAQARMAMQRLSNDLRNIPSPASITAIGSNQIVFVDESGTTVTFVLTGTDLTRNSQILANNVSSFVLTYFDRNGDTTSTINNIRYIQMSMSVTQNNKTNNFTTLVYLTHTN